MNMRGVDSNIERGAEASIKELERRVIEKEGKKGQ